MFPRVLYVRTMGTQVNGHGTVSLCKLSAEIDARKHCYTRNESSFAFIYGDYKTRHETLRAQRKPATQQPHSYINQRHPCSEISLKQQKQEIRSNIEL